MELDGETEELILEEGLTEDDGDTLLLADEPSGLKLALIATHPVLEPIVNPEAVAVAVV
mgnify:CR=1 FL=1